MLPRDQITKIRYFTARVTGLPHDASAATRQDTYLRALETLPLVEIHYGHIVTRTRRLPLANPTPGSPRMVEVLVTEEKRTDVNLASYLLLDAFTGACDTAVVVSNDSDLAEAIDIVTNVAGIKVGGGESPPCPIPLTTYVGNVLQAVAPRDSSPLPTPLGAPRQCGKSHPKTNYVVVPR